MDHLGPTGSERHDFQKGVLTSVSHTDPVLFFNEWYREATEKKCAEPYAFTLSTVSRQGQPSSRIVYMRELLPDGIVFYTNYLSRKGEEILKNPKVSALFYWDCCERQVRIEGEAESISAVASDAYFASRPRMSQIGAWASRQSSSIEDRSALEERFAHFEEKFPSDVPRPPHWGGYRIQPHYVEFWQGRPGRLHDRICYQKEADHSWKIRRIAP